MNSNLDKLTNIPQLGRGEAIKSQSPIEAKKLLSAIVDIAPTAIIVVDERQRIILYSRGAKELFGYSQQEVLGQPLDLLLPVSASETHQKHILAFAQAPETYRLMHIRRKIFGRRKDGSEFPAEAAISKHSKKGSIFIYAFGKDISSLINGLEF